MLIVNLFGQWANLCKAFLNEAKWYHSGYTPSFEEYIQNGVTSSSVPLLLTHSYFLIPNSFKEEEIKNLEEYPDIICFAGKIFRMVNDIGTYKVYYHSHSHSFHNQYYLLSNFFTTLIFSVKMRRVMLLSHFNAT